MDVSFSKAANAYMDRARASMEGGDETAGANDSAKPKFSDLLTNTVDALTESQHVAEAAKMGAISGTADLTDIVTAISSAELTLNTVVAVRDRVIAAYQDIMRMPI